MSRILIYLIFYFIVAIPSHASNIKKPNVLFILVDDLRVELGVYGAQHVKSPHIDQLAATGTRFANAYVSVPVCGASRASLLTGMRALPDRFKSYYTWVEKDAPEAITLFEQFKKNGYYTVGFGKIFHQAQDTAKKSWSTGTAPVLGSNQDPSSTTGWRDYQRPENIALYKKIKHGPSTEIFDGLDESYIDGKIAKKAISTISKLAKLDQPFFVAVGFVKPHLPFNAPKKYWDMYDADQFNLPYDVDDDPRYNLPKHAPDKAYHHYNELRAYSDMPEKPMPINAEKGRRLIHGYHASVSYVDAQVGKVLAELDRLGISDNTIVVLLGDHGYSLGEHGLWCKHSTFDVATKTPLIVRAPNMPQNQTVEGLVEFIDVFPTLTDLAGIPTPEQVAGISLASHLKDESFPAKVAVFPRYLSAEAIHTEQYTLTQWYNKQGLVAAEMLYDNINDPDETINLANLPDYQSIRKDLESQLKRHMTSRR
ncbi:MAG: sulfatase [Pseudomonadota bacterium]|nr:sulfatase [Pseudomonadota bacterium]